MSEPLARPVQAPMYYEFPKSTAGLLPWSHVVERLEQAEFFWLGTVRPDGRPHATPLWGCWVDEALYFDGSPETQWARNLAKNPAITMHLERGDDVVILEGAVEDLPTVSDPELAARIVACWERKYGKLHPDPVGRGLFRLRPRTVRAWSTARLVDGTRWHLGQAGG